MNVSYRLRQAVLASVVVGLAACSSPPAVVPGAAARPATPGRAGAQQPAVGLATVKFSSLDTSKREATDTTRNPFRFKPKAPPPRAASADGTAVPSARDANVADGAADPARSAADPVEIDRSGRAREWRKVGGVERRQADGVWARGRYCRRAIPDRVDRHRVDRAVVRRWSWSADGQADVPYE